VSEARFIVADVFAGLATLPDDSVDLVISSPPFLALRSYLPADHPDKAKEIGSEPTPAEFIDTLLDVVEACDRVLAPHGSLCFELGDTYAGTAMSGQRYDDWPGLADGYLRHERDKSGTGWPQDKSLCLIPESFRWALAYGRNPFNGRGTEPWRVRNVVRWHRPNPPVGALGDKFRPATSEMVVACKSRTRWFDLDAVRTEPQVVMGREVDGNNVKGSDDGSFRFAKRVDSNPAGAPPLDTWVIPTQPFSGSHYATFPEALVVKPILSMCPEWVCRECGEPRRRITEASYSPTQATNNATERGAVAGVNGAGSDPTFVHGRADKHVSTLGWTDCGHDDYRRGVVLDPFAGSGTVLQVATGHGRDAIGIDLDERNADLARERVGMFLSVEQPELISTPEGEQEC
jgi:site-specific DNA-methyltransferase (adenine-specific)